jgi:hypothetical protein
MLDRIACLALLAALLLAGSSAGAAAPPASADPPAALRVAVEKGALRAQLAPGGPWLPLALPRLDETLDLTVVSEDDPVTPGFVTFPGPEPGVWFVAVEATYGGTLHMGHVDRDGRLWRLRLPAGAPAPPAEPPAAAAPAPPQALTAALVKTEEGADFAAGANRPGNAARLYSGATGLSELDLRTLETRRIVRVPTPTAAECEATFESGAWEGSRSCACVAADGSGRGLFDIQPHASADGRRLWFTRAGFCGYEGDFWGQRMVLDVASGRLLAARPVAGVSVGPDGAVWYGDAPPDDDPWAGPSHAGWLFRAADGETRFRHVKVQARDEPGEPRLAETAVAQVLVDPKDARRLVVRTGRASNDARGEYGGDVYESRDAGATWKRLVPPLRDDDERERVESDGLLVSELVAPDGDLDHLVLRKGRQQAWVRRAGRWTREKPTAPSAPAAAAAPPAAPEAATLGVERVYQVAAHPRDPATRFAATSDGLYRTKDAGRTWERIARGKGVAPPSAAAPAPTPAPVPGPAPAPAPAPGPEPAPVPPLGLRTGRQPEASGPTPAARPFCDPPPAREDEAAPPRAGAGLLRGERFRPGGAAPGDPDGPGVSRPGGRGVEHISRNSASP